VVFTSRAYDHLWDPNDSRGKRLLVREATVGPGIVLDWYDGPLLEIMLVTYASGNKLVQVDTCLCQIEEAGPWPRATIRLSRENLQAALDLLDGKPVTDFHGEVIVCPEGSADNRFSECVTCVDGDYK
jgi:hypothetical protein